MSRTGRRKSTDPSEKVLISLRSSIATKVRLILAADPFYRDARTGLPRYGAISEVANQVFDRWVNEYIEHNRRAKAAAADTQHAAETSA